MLGELSALFAAPLGKDNWKLMSILSWALPYAHFSFAGFNMYPFTVINHSHEYNSFSESCNSFAESSNLRVIFETLKTTRLSIINMLALSLEII